jgi:hypothetical protein
MTLFRYSTRPTCIQVYHDIVQVKYKANLNSRHPSFENNGIFESPVVVCVCVCRNIATDKICRIQQYGALLSAVTWGYAPPLAELPPLAFHSVVLA